MRKYSPEHGILKICTAVAVASGALLLAACSSNNQLTTEQIGDLSPPARVDYDFGGGTPAVGHELPFGYFYGSCLKYRDFDPDTKAGWTPATVTEADGIITVKSRNWSQANPDELHFVDNGAGQTLDPADPHTAQVLQENDCLVGAYTTE